MATEKEYQPKPVGRPLKDPIECKSERLVFTMTPLERIKLEKLARKHKCTMNDILRQAIK